MGRPPESIHMHSDDEHSQYSQQMREQRLRSAMGQPGGLEAPLPFRSVSGHGAVATANPTTATSLNNDARDEVEVRNGEDGRESVIRGTMELGGRSIDSPLPNARLTLDSADLLGNQMSPMSHHGQESVHEQEQGLAQENDRVVDDEGREPDYEESNAFVQLGDKVVDAVGTNHTRKRQLSTYTPGDVLNSSLPNRSHGTGSAVEVLLTPGLSPNGFDAGAGAGAGAGVGVVGAGVGVVGAGAGVVGAGAGVGGANIIRGGALANNDDAAVDIGASFPESSGGFGIAAAAIFTPVPQLPPATQQSFAPQPQQQQQPNITNSAPVLSQPTGTPPTDAPTKRRKKTFQVDPAEHYAADTNGEDVDFGFF